MAKRVALITGGMGGLGEIISTKMADAGYTVVVTYSPSNTTAQKWTADMKARGYSFHAYPADVGDYDSCAACIDKISREVGPADTRRIYGPAPSIACAHRMAHIMVRMERLLVSTVAAVAVPELTAQAAAAH